MQLIYKLSLGDKFSHAYGISMRNTYHHSYDSAFYASINLIKHLVANYKPFQSHCKEAVAVDASKSGDKAALVHLAFDYIEDGNFVITPCMLMEDNKDRYPF